MADITVGVLALQGAFAKHIQMIQSLGCKAIEVRKPKDLDKCQGLIIPGGESTVITRQIKFIGMGGALQEFTKTKPIFGTCAGLILISREIIADVMQPMGLIDIAVERNAFGRQAESFTVDMDVELKSKERFKAVFIRAPRIRQASGDVKILARYEGEPVLVQQGHHLGASFHPELTGNPLIHQHFLDIVTQFG